jgi:acetylornithine deacetylase/succinyl-diaminopimelate desuccinylase-like protein
MYQGACTPLTRSAESTAIPSSVRVRVSIRIVPVQEVDAIAASLQAHLEATFRSTGSPNCLVVNVDHKADWWLGSLDDPWFKALEAAVRDEWVWSPCPSARSGYAALYPLHDALVHSGTVDSFDSVPGEVVRVSRAPCFFGADHRMLLG